MTAPDGTSHRSIWKDLWGVPFIQGYVDAGGIRTRFLRAGEPGKPVVVFLHGTGGHAEAYSRNLGAHGSDFCAYAIDMVGHGFTDKPPVDFEIPVYVDHLRAFLDAIGAETCLLSCESLGGWVAARFALDYPERVERLVLNTPGGSHANPDSVGRLRKLAMETVRDPTWERIRTRLAFLMKDKSKVTDDLIATRQYIYSRPGMVETMAHINVLTDMETRRRNMIPDEGFRAIDKPTLVLWTSDDPMADVDEGRRVARLIPGAVFVVMPDCGHWPQFEDPDVFNRIHLAFLRGETVTECVEAV